MAPILFEVSADGTPIVVFKHHSSRLPSGEVVHRKAKQTEELLVRNQFVRCTLPDGRVERRAAVHDPVLLFHWNVKSTSPTTENWLRKLCTYSMNINMSDEDKHDTNYINKHKYTNTDTRKLHL